MFKFTLPFLFISCFSFSQVPTASFSALPSTACIGATIVFTNTSNGGASALSYQWNFGDSTFSTLTNPTHTFTSAGTYNVTLLTTSANGFTASESQQIIIQPFPTPTFNAPESSNCVTALAPALISFNNTTPSIVGSNYLWDFGNGSTSTLQNPPAQTYTTNGSYTVSLTLTTSAGCSGTTSITDFITISNVTPSFSADFDGGCSPLIVQFTDQSASPALSNLINSWSWDFGNGSTSTLQNPPPQTYSALGFYNVSLTVTTQSGCVGTTVLNNFISVGQVNSINFTVDSDTNCIKTDFEFTSSVVVGPPIPGSSQITYYWDFNDGPLSTSTDQNPTYQYETDSGYFDVMLIVDYLGCKDTLVMNEMVYINGPIAFFDLDTNLLCNPLFLVSILNPANAVVTDASIQGVLSDNVEMIWQWGDGSPNTVLNDSQLDDADLGDTTHNYTDYGTYEIQQVIHNITTGCSDTSKQFFYVSQVTSDFLIPNDSICQGVEFQLTDLSSSSNAIDSYVFNMGNQNFVNNGPDPSYAYPDNGFFNVSLALTDVVGCSSTSTESILVIAPPFAVLSSSVADETGCFSGHTPILLNLSQVAESVSPINHFDWSFADGTPDTTTLAIPITVPASQQTSLEHTFIGEGVYVATLTAYNDFGCSSTATKEITLQRPSAFFTFPDNIICNGDLLNTDNLSVGVSPVTYEWYLDNTIGDTLSTDFNPSEPYIEANLPPGENSAIHNLILVAKDNKLCRDTFTVTFITSVPHADFTETLPSSVPCPPITGTYLDQSTSYGTINTWLWDFGNGNQSALQSPSNTYFFPGTYDLSLTVTDQYGCSDDTLFNDYIIVGGPSGNPQYSDTCSQTVNFFITNQNNIESALWDLGDGTTQSNLSFEHDYNLGTYSPNVTLTDAAGCEVVYPINPPINITNILNANFSASPNPVAMNAPVTVINQSSYTGSPIVSYLWDFGNGSTSIFENPPAQTYTSNGFYTVSLIITTSAGCTSTDSIIITINSDVSILPNVFTPNGDGTNDIFALDADYFSSFVFTVVNRWGNTIFEKVRDPSSPLFLWDAKTNGGEKCKDGVYFYRLKGLLNEGTEFDKTGYITLVNQ